MSIIKWTPFMGIEPDDWFNDFQMPVLGQGFMPEIDLYEDKGNLIAKTPLVDVDPKDIEVKVEGNVLTIKGATKKESEVEEKNYFRKEMRSGKFYRSVSLPKEVLADKVKADFEEGMLKVTMPIAEIKKKKEVKVAIKKGSKKEVKTKKK